MSDLSAVEGTPSPLGVAWVADANEYNFALYSTEATAVTLLLYGRNDVVRPSQTIALPYETHKSGRVWHTRVAAATAGDAAYYAYRVDGQNSSTGRFDSQKILVDPYSRGVFFPPNYDRTAACAPGPNDGRAPLGLLRKGLNAFDWGNDHRPRHGADAVIYEMHVRGFTADPSAPVQPGNHGTYAGVIDMIGHLKSLGVNVVELMPVHQFDPQEGSYWGYMTLNFFSPHHAYARGGDPDGAFDEFRAMVKALHDADIEVVLDVVYNHTTEGDAQGPTLSYRGIDNGTYYLLESDLRTYRNDTGCGNVLRASHPAVQRLIADSLRFWYEEMHVDGFRFDLASIFALDNNGGLDTDSPSVLSVLAQDPDLAALRLIAEPWNEGTRRISGSVQGTSAYLLGRSFPAQSWLQWNDRYRSTVRRYMKSDLGLAGDLATRLYGSVDLFPDTGAANDIYRPLQSVNYVSSHDGLCLYDLVAYNQPTDEAWDEYSWDCGAEGDTQVPPDVETLRKRQIKNFCCLLMLANGTPMFVAGDEFLRTQQGRRNPYNQDNAISWLDWTRRAAHPDILRFFSLAVGFRIVNPFLSLSRFWHDGVQWYGTAGAPDWSYASRTLACGIHGSIAGGHDLYVMTNAYWEPVTFTIQEWAPGVWCRAVDTALNAPNDILDLDQRTIATSPDYVVSPRSTVIFART